MNMQSGAAEQEPCCVLAGTLIKVAQICCKRGQKKKCLALVCELVWVWRKTEEVCEVNLRREWSYLAGSASGWE